MEDIKKTVRKIWFIGMKKIESMDKYMKGSEFHHNDDVEFVLKVLALYGSKENYIKHLKLFCGLFDCRTIEKMSFDVHKSLDSFVDVFSIHFNNNSLQEHEVAYNDPIYSLSEYKSLEKRFEEYNSYKEKTMAISFDDVLEKLCRHHKLNFYCWNYLGVIRSLLQSGIGLKDLYEKRYYRDEQLYSFRKKTIDVYSEDTNFKTTKYELSPYKKFAILSKFMRKRPCRYDSETYLRNYELLKKILVEVYDKFPPDISVEIDNTSECKNVLEKELQTTVTFDESSRVSGVHDFESFYSAFKEHAQYESSKNIVILDNGNMFGCTLNGYIAVKFFTLKENVEIKHTEKIKHEKYDLESGETAKIESLAVSVDNYVYIKEHDYHYSQPELFVHREINGSPKIVRVVPIFSEETSDFFEDSE